MKTSEQSILRRLRAVVSHWLPPLPEGLAQAYRAESTRKFRELSAAALPFGSIGFLGFALWEASYDVALLRKTWLLRVGLAAFFVIAGLLARHLQRWAEGLYLLSGAVCCAGVMVLGTLVPAGKLLAFGGSLMTLSFAFVLSREIGRVLRAVTLVIVTMNTSGALLGYTLRDLLQFDGYLVATAMVLLVASVIQERTERAAFSLDVQMRDLAHTDPLTSLPNRRRLLLTLPHLLALADRGRTPLCLMVIDLDHFKAINDTHGHAAGDAVLQAFGPLLVAQLRSADFVARVGGEEFVVVLPLTPLTGGHCVAERLREAIARTPLVIGSVELRLSISLGLAERCPGEDGETLQKRADAALYVAKRQGRNRVAVAELPVKL